MIDIVNEIAIEAGKQILDIYKLDFNVSFKSDNSPLTEADIRSNEVIISKLNRHFPGIPIISEETKATPFEQRKNWQKVWIIDPLDGTKEFIKKNGEFTVNIALIENGSPVLGVIYAPATNNIWYAEKGKGIFKNGKKIAPETQSSNNKIRVIYTRSHKNEELLKFLSKLENEYDEVVHISIGSSLKFALLAEGSADIYPRFQPIHEWDTAAGHALLLESGKNIYDFDTNEEVKYNKHKLKHNWFIAK